MPERRPSLRRRLMVLLVAGTALAWCAIAIGTWLDVRHHAGRLFDAQLTEYSEVLSAVAGHEVYEMAGEVTQLDHEYGHACTYQVYTPGGQLLMRSHAAPEAPLAARDGFSDVQAAGARWRAFLRVDAQNAMVIIVAHKMDERDALVADFARRTLWPLAVGLPLLALVVWLAVTHAVAPLERLAGQLRGREASRLAPVVAPDAPAEIRPLVDALNQLFARLEDSFENERRFTGDAAHELRTPLAALRTHAEVALTTANDERRRRSLEQVVASVDRASRLVERLLTLARLDSAQALPGLALDFAELVRDAGLELQEEARARGVEVRVMVPDEPVAVRGDPSMLQVLLRNLLENAVRHAGAHGMAKVSVVRTEGEVELEVEDSGPGVPPELRERIFDRHFRGPGEGGSAGLGLSIARRIATLHGGRIVAQAGRSLPGLRVIVALPGIDKDSLRRPPHSGTVSPPTQEVPA
jgi:two-component system sensor histidine kinase QseC